MLKKMIVLPAFVLSLSLSQAVFSHMNDTMVKDHVQKHSGHHCMHHMMKNLDLTSEQKEKISELKAKTKQELSGKMHELQVIRHEMRAIVQSDKVDDAKLAQLIHQKKEIIGSITKSKVMLNHQIYHLLDSKQQAKYSEMAKKCDEMRHH